LKVESDAFPEEERKEQKLHSKGHEVLLKKIFRSEEGFNEDRIYYRPLTREDLEEMKELHSEWFPLSYRDDFFERIFA